VASCVVCDDGGCEHRPATPVVLWQVACHAGRVRELEAAVAAQRKRLAEAAREARAEGMSVSVIAAAVGVSRQRAYRLLGG